MNWTAVHCVRSVLSQLQLSSQGWKSFSKRSILSIECSLRDFFHFFILFDGVPALPSYRDLSTLIFTPHCYFALEPRWIWMHIQLRRVALYSIKIIDFILIFMNDCTFFERKFGLEGWAKNIAPISAIARFFVVNYKTWKFIALHSG